MKQDTDTLVSPKQQQIFISAVISTERNLALHMYRSLTIVRDDISGWDTDTFVSPKQ